MHVEASAVPVGTSETVIATVGPIPAVVPGNVPVVIRGSVQWTGIAGTTSMTVRIRQGTGPSLAALPNLGPVNGFVTTCGASAKASTPFRLQDPIGSPTGYTITGQGAGATITADFCSVDIGLPL